jgi:hypothetical protein
MVVALRNLADQAPPSSAVIPGLLDGLKNVERLLARWLPRRPAELPTHISGAKSKIAG